MSLRDHRGSRALLALSLFCLVLMFADKVMVDEIRREIRLGWETLGEWIILYCMLVIQLTYNVIFVLQALKKSA